MVPCSGLVRLFLGGVGARFGVFVLVVWRWLFEGAGVLVVLFWCVGGLPLIFQKLQQRCKK